MSDKIDFAIMVIMVILAALFSICVGLLVNAIQAEAERAAQPQQWTVTIEYAPAENKEGA